MRNPRALPSTTSPTRRATELEVGTPLRVWTEDKGNSQTGDMGDSGTMGARVV